MEAAIHSNTVYALSGGLGSVIGISICYPLETARTRLQVDDGERGGSSLHVVTDIYRREGLNALYRGLWSMVVALFATNFVYFYTFHGSRALLWQHGYQYRAMYDLALGTVAGIVTVLCTGPLWMVNTRLKLQGAQLKSQEYLGLKRPRYSGVLDCLLRILQDDGLVALWSGTLPSLVLVTNPAVQFMVYETTKRNLQLFLHTEDLGAVVYFLLGGVSKFTATVVTYPMQIVQSRLRVGFHATIVSSMQDIVRSNGVIGLFRGLESKLSQTVLTAAVMFVVYEKLTVFTLWVLQRGQISRDANHYDT